jgi:hypothetical protein
MLATALSLVLMAMSAVGPASEVLAQPSPTPVVLTDGIAAGIVRGIDGFGTASLIVPTGMTVTYLVQTDPALAGSILSIWTRGPGDAWARVTSRIDGRPRPWPAVASSDGR